MDEISILYPPPPPYYKVFTAENVARMGSLRKAHPAAELASVEEVQTSSLKYLVPPQKADHPVYHSFGNVWQFKDKFMNLTDAGIQQLYPETGPTESDDEDIFTQERIVELKKMTKSLLLNFLELVGLLVKNPYYVNDKIEQIRVILINLHHLLNSYRLHQSREDLILKIEDKIQSTLQEVGEIDQTVAAIETRFRTMLQKIDTVADLKSTDRDTDRDADRDAMEVDDSGAVQAAPDHDNDDNDNDNDVEAAREALIQKILAE